MKKLHYLRLAFVLLMAFSPILLSAQSETFNAIKEAIKTGNSKEVVKYFNQSVDINLEGAINTHSKVQAEFVLREFFKKHPLTDFTIVHTGSSKGGLQYAIGKYICATENFIVTIRMREVGKTLLANEISFIKE
jgi:hypothetical protein